MRSSCLNASHLSQFFKKWSFVLGKIHLFFSGTNQCFSCDIESSNNPTDDIKIISKNLDLFINEGIKKIKIVPNCWLTNTDYYPCDPLSPSQEYNWTLPTVETSLDTVNVFFKKNFLENKSFFEESFFTNQDCFVIGDTSKLENLNGKIVWQNNLIKVISIIYENYFEDKFLFADGLQNIFLMENEFNQNVFVQYIWNKEHRRWEIDILDSYPKTSNFYCVTR